MESRLDTFIRQSRKEFLKYKKTRKDIYLAQAGEKLWNAFQLLVGRIVGTQIRNYQALKRAIRSIEDNIVYETYLKTYDLHKFFYRGYTEDIREVLDNYLIARSNINLLKERYKIGRR